MTFWPEKCQAVPTYFKEGFVLKKAEFLTNAIFNNLKRILAYVEYYFCIIFALEDISAIWYFSI